MSSAGKATLALRNGKAFIDGKLQDADILIEDGRISRIGTRKSIRADEEIDVRGNAILPGMIDAHVHFRDPGHPHKEDFRTGSMAAAAGGVTTVLDMPNTLPPTVSQAELARKKALARKSLVNYGLYAGATRENLGKLDAMRDAVAAKVYHGSSTGTLLLEGAADLAQLMESTRKLIVIHSESEELIRHFSRKHASTQDHNRMRDPVAAAVSTAEAVLEARRLGARLHIAHMTTADEVAILRAFKTASITCEASPHHLLLTSAFARRRGNYGKVNPPLRSEQDRKALWEGIRDGTVDMVATDHAPHTREEKEQPFAQAPSGVPGVQTMLPLMLTQAAQGRISLADVVRLCAHAPARIFRIEGRGHIARGFWADLVVVDLARKATITHAQQLSRCGWTPFHGTKAQGWPVLTLVNGTVVYAHGQIVEGSRGMQVGIASGGKRG